MKSPNPKFLNKGLHQGDTQWFLLDGLPSNAKKVEKTFIAKSERSGNAHALCGDYEMFVDDAVEGFFIKVGAKGATLNHTGYDNLTAENLNTNKTLPKRDHGKTLFTEGIYFVGIQQRKKQFSKVWEKNKD